MGDENHGPEMTDQQLLAVLANADDRNLRSDEVVEELPIQGEDLLDRFDDLDERGLVVRVDEDEPGERWQITPDGLDAVSISEEEIETDTRAQASKTTGVETSPRDVETADSPPPDPQDHPQEPLHESVDDRIQVFDPPGDDDQAESRRDALRRAYDYLRTRGRAGRAEFEADVYPDAMGGYDSSDAWWDEVIEPGLETLPDVAFLEAADEWRVVEERDEATEP